MTLNRRDVLLGGGAVASVAAGTLAAPAVAQTGALSIVWHLETDVLVIGSGATGIPAAITAKEAGSAVLVVEAQKHTGGHGIVSGGLVPLGGGTSVQKKWGVKDSPDLVFQDLTDWSVTQSNGGADYRYNDREVIRAFADNCAATCEFLLEHGVVFEDVAPDPMGGGSVGNSIPREMHTVPMDWPLVQTGKPAEESRRRKWMGPSGNGFMQPLLAAAKKLGIEILTSHKMIAIHRESPRSGSVIGISCDNDGKQVNIRARKAVIIATGGSSTNVNFRRMFDPRLTEEYCGVAGMPWSEQDASGEIAGMAIGASLWGLANNTGEFGARLAKPGTVGCQYNYHVMRWYPGSEVFPLARASGLPVKDYQNVIAVNMLGKRFYDEFGDQFDGGNYDPNQHYVPNSWRNAKGVNGDPKNYINAAMAGFGDGHNGGGPIWAIFDAAAVEREKWDPRPPFVDFDAGFFFQADTIAELASKIKMKYQRLPMPPENLEATVARYNSFVDSGVDEDFDKPKPLYKIAKPPFYAGWATPNIHDTRAGLRINAKCQVVDMNGEVIPGLYCGGESAGGFSLHGLARASTQGRIAGREAAAEAART